VKFLLDTAPLLNFLAAGEQNVLIQYAHSRGSRLCVAQIVESEVLGHFENPLNRFKGTAAEGTWRKVVGVHIQVLHDDLYTPYGDRVRRELAFIRPPASGRGRKDLGEDLTMAHAAVLALDGHEVEMLIDEQRAVARFNAYLTMHLDRRYPGTSARITFTSTRTVIDAADTAWLNKAADKKQLLQRLAAFDDGLVADS